MVEKEDKPQPPPEPVTGFMHMIAAAWFRLS